MSRALAYPNRVDRSPRRPALYTAPRKQAAPELRRLFCSISGNVGTWHPTPNVRSRESVHRARSNAYEDLGFQPQCVWHLRSSSDAGWVRRIAAADRRAGRTLRDDLVSEEQS
jgi:hypothetical protein